MPQKKPAIFQPIIKLTGERTPADKIAERMVYAMHREVIETMNTERSQQTTIGLSEIGTDCMKCLVRKLAQVDDGRAIEDGWKAQIGTFGHLGLEGHFEHRYHSDQVSVEATRYLLEVDPNVTLHLEEDLVLPLRDGREIPGHCDLFIEGANYGIVWDHKFLGPSSLKSKSAGKIGPDYEHQLNGYGLGWELKGKTVTHVALGALPRDGEVNEAAFILQRYDRQMIVDRLALITDFYAASELIGWERLIEAQPKASGTMCWDCKRFEMAEERSFDAMFLTK